MSRIRGEGLVAIGFVMVLLGSVIPWLIVLKIIPSTLFLNFFSYTVSVAGLFLGITGLAFSVRTQREKRRRKDFYNEPPDDHRDW